MYVIGTCVPDFPSSLHIRRRLSYVSVDIVIKVHFFELLLPIDVRKAGF
ncbi:MAG: hypothetical protein NAG76_02595 [Candidatus Pristimantibacillus lignocellulolyticus]|uniref:Uncharacterized protein n=1 Tax=Candidatus Pristimantibacillus lignocellulolyticus TaxID=2994561 RepID=A0A9J6ZGB2_9BACL|nr:MAG: hypothetical protein NAG76_02595 [Candidatus Pristimantibacillus lignocellulolyticus]